MKGSHHRKILDSKHLSFVLDCLDKEFSLPQIQKLLKERGLGVSIPTLSELRAKYRAEGRNIIEMSRGLGETASLVAERVRKIPGLSTLVDRRNFVIDSIMDRRRRLIEYLDEQDRSREVREYISKAISAIDDEGDVLKARQVLQSLDSYVDKNFANGKPYPQVETLIRQYTMDLHDIFKYVEDWTRKQELDTLIDTVCRKITQAAIDSFGQYLKTDDTASRDECVRKFVDAVNSIASESKEQTLDADRK